MDAKYKLVSEINERIQTGEEVLADAYSALGRYAADKAREEFPDGNIRAMLDNITETAAAIENASRTEKRILEAVQRLEDLRKDLLHIENENSRMEEENLPAYEEFGRVSADSSGEKTLSAEAQEVRQKIHEIHREGAETDEKVADLRRAAQEKPLLAKMLGTGKAMLLDSSKNLRRRKLGKLHRSLGRLMLQSMEDIPPETLFDVYRANRKKLRENTLRAESLASEQTALEEELRELGVEKRFHKRIKDLEIQNKKNTSRHAELLQLTGKELYEKHKGFGEEEPAAGLFCDIEDCIQRNAEYAEEKKKLEAAIEYDNLTRKIHDLREKLESEEAAMNVHASNIEKIRKQIAVTEEERSGVEKTNREGCG